MEEELEISQLEILSNFVRQAISNLKQGDSKSYLELVQIFQPNSERKSDGKESKKLVVWLKALAQQVTLLDKTSSSLVNSILSYNWLKGDQNQNEPEAIDIEFYEAYSLFLINLISAQPIYTLNCCKMLVGYFKYDSEVKTEPEETDRVTTRLVARVHTLLKKLLVLIPTAANVLQNSIIEQFPRNRASLKVWKHYVGNLFLVMQYLPFSRDQLFQIVMEKVLKLDVEIQVEVEELSLDTVKEEEVLEEEIFNLEINEKRVSQQEQEEEELESSDVEVEHIKEKETDPNQVLVLVKKLDTLLGLMFNYIDTLTQFELYDFFSINLKMFETTILPTFKSRYCQFLIFYLSSKDVQFTNALLGRLYHIATSTHESNVLKLASAHYLGSFIARAKFLSDEYLFTLASMVTSWLDDYLSKWEHGVVLDFHLHLQFYAVVQALLYIFCFRWRSFQLQPNLNFNFKLSHRFDPWHPSITPLRHILNANLNPLHNCAQSVVNMFAQISHQTKFMYCYSILELNRNNLPSQLKGETFFPFDPYALPTTLHRIDPIYQPFVPFEELNWKSNLELNLPIPNPKLHQLNQQPSKLASSIEELAQLDLASSFNSMSLSPTTYNLHR